MEKLKNRKPRFSNLIILVSSLPVLLLSHQQSVAQTDGGTPACDSDLVKNAIRLGQPIDPDAARKKPIQGDVIVGRLKFSFNDKDQIDFSDSKGCKNN